MKQLVFLLSTSLLLLSCASNEPALVNDHVKIDFQNRSKEDVIEIANQFCNQKRISRTDNYVVNSSSITPIPRHTSRSANDTLMYAVDLADNCGYLIISAKKATEPIMAFIDEGTYAESKDSNNSGFNQFMEYAAEYIASKAQEENSAITDPGTKDFVMLYKTDTLKTITSSGARVKVEWGQNWPENLFCPNKLAGCSPVAVAQLFSYFKPSISLDLTFSGKPYDKLNVNWDELLTHTKSVYSNGYVSESKELHSIQCPATSDTHTQLGALVRELGVQMKSQYLENGTGTHSNEMFDIACKYHDGFTFPIYGDAYSSLFHSGVVLMGGAELKEVIDNQGQVRIDTIGHTWLADGVADIKYNITTYYNYDTRTGQYDYKEERLEESHFVHCNWGWCGRNNGYFLNNVYDTSNRNTDIRFTRSRYNFNYKVDGLGFYK